jgi:hypothetical protein
LCARSANFRLRLTLGKYLAVATVDDLSVSRIDNLVPLDENGEVLYSIEKGIRVSIEIEKSRFIRQIESTV